MLRRHPHLQGFILGTTLLAVAAVATPYALSCITGLTGSDRAPIPVHDDNPAGAAREATEPTVTAAPASAEPTVGLDGKQLPPAADTP